MKTMQELLEGLNSATLSIWKDACERHASMLKCTLETANSLVHLIEIHNQFHTTKWALGQIETELKRRDELAEQNRKALGLDQPDLGESLWLEGYGEQLDPDQERRLSVQKRIREKLDKLPPMVTPPKDDPRWKDLELIPEKGDRVRVVRRTPPKDSPNFERRGAFTIYRNGNEHFTFQDFDVLASGPSSLLLKEALPPVVEKRKRTCGNCVNWSQYPQNAERGWCNALSFASSATWVQQSCSQFDPIPLPQTPPAEAVKVAESLINICGNCAFHSHKQDPAGFCAKLGCKMPPTNPVDPCVHFRSKPASERAIAALDTLPTQEEFDPNDPRR